MILLVRHGRTVFNVEGRLQGRLDSPLTEQGVRPSARFGRDDRPSGCGRIGLDGP